MAFIIEFYVDGACRGNGRPGAIGAAAAVRRYRDGMESHRTSQLNTDEHRATNQRAEILAIILALEWAMDIYDTLNNSPRITVTIHSDSKYAVNCMNEWLALWSNKGWITSSGSPVANQDILRDAIDAENRVLHVGKVVYKRVRRDKVSKADELCNEVLNNM